MFDGATDSGRKSLFSDGLGREKLGKNLGSEEAPCHCVYVVGGVAFRAKNGSFQQLAETEIARTPVLQSKIPGGYSVPYTMSITALRRRRSESGIAAKRNGCSVQETGCSISAVPLIGPLGVTNINLTIEPGGRSEAGTTRPPVIETHCSFPETRLPSWWRRTMGIALARRRR